MESLTSPRRLAAAARAAEALALRTAGHDFNDIARRLGFRSRAGAFLAVKAALARVPAEDAHTYRAMNLKRLNSARRAIWPRVEEGHLPAVDRELHIQERETAYLGLDAPKPSAPPQVILDQRRQEVHLALAGFTIDELRALLAATMPIHEGAPPAQMTK